MHHIDESPADRLGPAAPSASRDPVSVALLAAVACVPIVVAIGFITDNPDGRSMAVSVPGDISILALRGGLDAGFERRPGTPARAGY